MRWRIVPGSAATRNDPALPGSLVSIGSPFHHESMPGEVAMLLPTNRGPGGLIEFALANPSLWDEAMLGLFLAGPFLNVELESDRLRRAGISWIANLPSVGQQDNEFARQLPDVGLDFGREMDCLARFRAAGFRAAAVVTDAPGAAAAAAVVDPEVMMVMPRIADFAAGFPSLRQRSSAAQSVADTARGGGWAGMLLGLGEEREADSMGLWPGCLDGLVCRPATVGTED